MKKHKLLVKSISGVLSLVFIFMSMLVLFVSADNNTASPDCVSDHFSKLRYNINSTPKYRVPRNIIGTCTHSAMSMLLSFYDFYWSDDFVPTIYEADGTYHQMGWENGIYNSTTSTVYETFSAYPESNAWDNWTGDYESFAEYYETKYLQPYLMSIADSEIVTSAIGITGLLDSQVVRVLEEYLTSRGLGPEQGVEVHIEYGFPTLSNFNANRETLFNTIKEKINDGHPVMFLGLDHIDVIPDVIDGTEWGIYAHAMVAYDVVGTGDNEDILLHTGWNGDETQYYNSTPYSNLNSAIWIEIDDEQFPHECTKKYVDQSDSTKTYCACEIYKNHPAHDSHHLSVENKMYTNSTHHWTNACHCGEPGPNSIISLHNFTYSYYTPTQHYKTCQGCIYMGAENHSYDSFTSVSNTHHANSCICGEVSSTQEAHTPLIYVSSSTSSHSIYCKCGHLISQDLHEMTIISPRLSKCIHCGYVRDNSIPGQIIMGIEEEYDICKE